MVPASLAQQARNGELPRPTGFLNSAPYLEAIPAPPNMTPEEQAEWQNNRMREAIRKQEQERRDQQASTYEHKAREVMKSGPFGEFGGPTEAQIRLYAMMGMSEIPSSSSGSAGAAKGRRY